MNDRSSMPLTATHWGAYRVETEDGRVRALHPFEEDAAPSPIGRGMVDTQDDRLRIGTPCVRRSWLDHGPGANTAGRGAEPFVAVSWDTAERLVAGEISRVRDNWGNSAIYAGSYGWASAGRFHHAQSQMHRFLNCVGGYTAKVNTYSYAAAEVVIPHILGDFAEMLCTTTGWDSIAAHTRLFVAFGGIPLKNGQVNPGGAGRHVQGDGLAAARRAGVEFVNVGPLRSDIEAFAQAEWLALCPGTDTAVLLGIAHMLHTEGLADREFLDRYTQGFEVFARYLEGVDDGIVKSAQWAAGLSGLNADDIRRLARRMAAVRTMISVSWSLTRQDHGEQPYWAAVAVAAMLGQIGLPGGGIGFGYSATNYVGANTTGIPGAAFPKGRNPVRDFIPVARISDMLQNPGAPFDFNGGRYRYPDIHLVYWAGGNPFHHHQDLGRLREAWRRPDTVIAHDWCWNPLARHADIVLPCTTALERNDLSFSPRDPYIIAMRQAVPPFAESRNDFDIFAAIAARLGVADEFTGGRDEAAWLRWIFDETRTRCARIGVELPDYETLQRIGWHRIDDPPRPKVMLEAFREDPEANPLATPSGRIEIFSATVAGFGYDDCPGYPAWMEPEEWLGGDRGAYPMHLISNQPSTRLHSQLDHGSHSRAAKIHGREAILIHPRDAAPRGIGDGDLVRVFNDRGACLAGVVIEEGVREGVVVMSTGAWFDPAEPGAEAVFCRHGNPNVLTRDRGTSRLAQGPSAQSCLVQVERFDGDPPPVGVFDPPEILRTDRGD